MADVKLSITDPANIRRKITFVATFWECIERNKKLRETKTS